ncbi:helix-turn-helix transcriptional regulator [Flavobacterium piscis]|uniref:Transcriptional regulator with XRE-family HTH domain n=1 Tax=Flavobacterium piscis TaxID=1114874 RepID=A0ABU1Y6C9_9FLAO|nr:helix-turn-helix transcriptional regulator [Flavobacterium piscis]MDR7209782.1 transcriptional regulator with XRE-family HTH domain [Flavobacterium piscis]
MNAVIGNKLKQLRKSKGMSQEQVADYLHVSQSAYARMESGESHSWASHINDICRVFEISPEELVKSESVVINNNQQGGNFNNATIINQLSEKLIEQYEERIKELKDIIADLKTKG